MMASSSDTTPVKTVQLEGKIIAITGANRGIYNSTPNITQHKVTNTTPGIDLGIADCCLSNGAKAI